jgi:glucose-6-phosphate isomerase
MGESIGKTADAGITPTVSIGSTDLHSVGQLYLGGPLDKFTSFIWARNCEDPMALPKKPLMPGLVQNLEGASAHSIMGAILEGVEMAYSKKELPFMEIVMPEISEFAIGEFMQYKMIEMMYLGKLMNVNAFDQPNVELYKIETARKLKNLHA